MSVKTATLEFYTCDEAHEVAEVAVCRVCKAPVATMTSPDGRWLVVCSRRPYNHRGLILP